MKNIFLIARNEFLQICREPQFLVPYFLVPLIMIGIYAVYLLSSKPLEQEGIFISRLLMILVGVLVTSMTLALCADSFAGEKERNTLEILLCAPVSLRVLFWGKVLGIFPLSVIVGWLGQAVVLGLAVSNNLVSWGFVHVVLVFLLTPASALFITSLSIFISLRAETVRGAAQISGIFVLFFLFSIQAVSHWFFLSPWNAVGLLGILFIFSLLIIYRCMVKFEDVIYQVK